MTISNSIVLHGIPWATYECLVDTIDSPGTRLTYDNGDLEIMPPTPNHEEPIRALNTLVEIITAEWNWDTTSLGASTIRLPEALRGFEPDSCYHLVNVAHLPSTETLNLAVNPPDLAVEVNLTIPSLKKLPMYAQVGVRELWRFTPIGGGLTLFVLSGSTYEEREASIVLAPLTREIVRTLLAERFTLGRAAWTRRLRAWAQENAPQRNQEALSS